jgi:predicted nucleotidyltransferase
MKMIQPEFKDVVFEFAKRVSDIPVVRSVILFGSVAKGEADARSDADLLIVLDVKGSVSKLPERKRVSEVALDLEKKFGRRISLVFSNRNFDRLDRQFVETVLTEGSVLYGGVPRVAMRKLELEPHTLVYFSLRGMEKSEKMKLKRALYGHRTFKWHKGKTYKSETTGLVERLGGKRTGIASILVPARSFKELRSVLERFGAEYEKEDVWISRI